MEGTQQYNGMWQLIQEYIDAQISRHMDSLCQLSVLIWYKKFHFM